MSDKNQRQEEGRMDEQQMADVERMLQAETEQRLTTNVGFSQPGAPTHWAGTDPNPTSGGIGALDPGGGSDIVGDDQGRERSIISGPTPTIPEPGDNTGKTEDDAKDRIGGGSTTGW